MWNAPKIHKHQKQIVFITVENKVTKTFGIKLIKQITIKLEKKDIYWVPWVDWVLLEWELDVAWVVAEEFGTELFNVGVCNTLSVILQWETIKYFS